MNHDDNMTVACIPQETIHGSASKIKKLKCGGILEEEQARTAPTSPALLALGSLKQLISGGNRMLMMPPQFVLKFSQESVSHIAETHQMIPMFNNDPHVQ